MIVYMKAMSKPKNKLRFIGIGAPKSASTWLCKCLGEHPEIGFSGEKTRKELHYFNTLEGSSWDNTTTGVMSYYDKGLDWYLKQFPDGDNLKAIGEFTVSYMFDLMAHKRILQDFPDVKLIVTLRNPPDMLHSLYWYLKSGAVSDMPKTFKEVLNNKHFINKGYYYKHLKRFYEIFPHENIYIILFDDIVSKPKEVLENLYQYLGVDPNYKPAFLNTAINSAFKTKSTLFKNTVHITLKLIDKLKLDHLRLKIFESQLLQDIYTFLNKKPTKNPKLNSSDRQIALDLFSEDINNLEKLINRDLTSWKSIL